MSDWKPGDVGIAEIDGKPVRIMRGRLVEWVTEEGYARSARDGLRTHPELVNPRRLVVVDPEDPHQVARLADAFCSARWSHMAGDDECDPLTRSSMQTALETYLAPAPEEPTGLGAVVEDRWGHRFVLTAADEGRWWNVNEDQGCTWDHVKAVRVLSEGVTP